VTLARNSVPPWSDLRIETCWNDFKRFNVKKLYVCVLVCVLINPMMLNDHCSGRTTSLTSKRCILYIYSKNIGTEYFKHGIYSSKCSFFFFFHNSNVFGSCIIHILYTGCAKIKKNNSGTKRLNVSGSSKCVFHSIVFALQKIKFKII